MARKSQTRRILDRVGHELKVATPAIVKHTARKFGPARAARQKTAILLSKARKAGAKVGR